MRSAQPRRCAGTHIGRHTQAHVGTYARSPSQVRKYARGWLASSFPFLNVVYNSLVVKTFDTFGCTQVHV